MVSFQFLVMTATVLVGTVLGQDPAAEVLVRDGTSSSSSARTSGDDDPTTRVGSAVSRSPSIITAVTGADERRGRVVRDGGDLVGGEEEGAAAVRSGAAAASRVFTARTRELKMKCRSMKATAGSRGMMCPKAKPTRRPRNIPTTTTPTKSPTKPPTKSPTKLPTAVPTTRYPTRLPTAFPTKFPTSSPAQTCGSEPSVCGDLRFCAGGTDCVCFDDTEGGVFCGSALVVCQDQPLCDSSNDCGPESPRCTAACCDDPICVPLCDT